MENKMKEKSIAIITARGGSKRIPKKNIKEFCGKPIIAYSIEAALKSGIFSEVMVSTDSHKIAEIARSYGAEVPFLRSERTSDDYATTSDVILEVLSEYEQLGRTFEYICCIYPTAPFITREKLQFAMEMIERDGVEAVMPVVEFSYPPQGAILWIKIKELSSNIRNMQDHALRILKNNIMMQDSFMYIMLKII